ncbi:MAG: glycoside hydrolase family 97 protein [Lentisphaerae bacterium]|nr:glycoside hydrolase family 97 protein [Lentisphaerota bacterium]
MKTWILAGWAAVAGVAAAESWTVASPDGKLTATVKPGAALTYSVALGGAAVLDESPLGIVRDDQRFVEGLAFVAESRAKIAGEYAMPHGKRSRCRVDANELTLAFRAAGGARVDLVLRASNDGLALRYVFPETNAAARTVTEELTGFQLPAKSASWTQPYDESTKWTPAYERLFENGLPAGTYTTNKAGWCFPALFRAGENGPWALLTEAGADGSYCGSRLASAAPGGLYRIRFPDAGEGLKTGAVAPTAPLPWATPWRVVIAGATPAAIVESTLVQDLNPPGPARTPSWIRPGRAAWSWWSEQDSPRRPERMKAFIDLAAEMGWEYFLVDANWNYVDEPAVLDLVRYAKAKKVGLLFWYNSGGPHNEVTEAPRDRMMPRDIRRREFAWLQKLGVKGVKVDFFQSDKQNLMQHYLDILRDAADFDMMVNFHGCTIPRGWQRTFPHLMTMEGVRGAECYIFDPKFPAAAPSHNTILAFTRNVVGSMDYTPVTFSDNNNPRKTTAAHELALSVVFESGWQHLADGVASYRAQPDFVKDFLRAVPVAWDDVKFLAGAPGDHIALARRKGDDWYLGAINGIDQAVTLKLPLDFLSAGTAYAMTRIGDGSGPRAFDRAEAAVRAGAAPLEVTLQPFGGAVVHLRKK